MKQEMNTEGHSNLDESHMYPSNTQIIVYGRIKRLKGVNLPDDIILKIACFEKPGENGERVPISIENHCDLAFIGFVEMLEFTDISVAYFLYNKYILKAQKIVTGDALQLKSEITLEYNLYFAENLGEILDIIARSPLMGIISPTLDGDGQEQFFNKAGLIKQVGRYVPHYNRLTLLQQDIFNIENKIENTKKVVKKLLSDSLLEFVKSGTEISDSLNIQELIAARDRDLNEVFSEGGNTITRALGLRWHVQRLFLPFLNESNKKLGKKCRKALGVGLA